jgi:hypothetical protein
MEYHSGESNIPFFVAAARSRGVVIHAIRRSQVNSGQICNEPDVFQSARGADNRWLMSMRYGSVTEAGPYMDLRWPF